MRPAPNRIATRLTIRWTITWAALACLPLTTACTVAGKSTACDGLTYEKTGPGRKEYLPCASEMMATLDRLDSEIQKMLAGDESARGDARASVREMRSLLKEAGGRDMLEGWNDRALTSLNVDIWNTFNHHEACMMVAGQLFGRAPLGDEKKREPARVECKAYQRAYQDANIKYRRIR